MATPPALVSGTRTVDEAPLAGSLSLAVSLPTVPVPFARYSRDGSFAVLGEDRWFVALMAGGSVAGTVTGAWRSGPFRNASLCHCCASSACYWAHR